MKPNSTTTVRAWTAEGYHKDLLVIDHNQVWLHEHKVSEAKGRHLLAGKVGSRMVIDPKDFPEMVEFEIIVEECK